MESAARLSWSPRLGRWGRLTLQRTSSVACPRSFSEFWDDEVVPLICPTCQAAFGLTENTSAGNHLATVHGVVFVVFVQACSFPAVRVPLDSARVDIDHQRDQRGIEHE